MILTVYSVYPVKIQLNMATHYTKHWKDVYAVSGKYIMSGNEKRHSLFQLFLLDGISYCLGLVNNNRVVSIIKCFYYAGDFYGIMFVNETLYLCQYQ